MPDRATIERIAKFIARASMNDSQHEADAAIKSAYARMQRDGVSLDDVLSLPEELLYQKGLMDLVAYMVGQETTLSESSKRDLYARYVGKVAARFSKDARGSESSRAGEGTREESRKHEEKTYKHENVNTSERSNAFSSQMFDLSKLFRKEHLEGVRRFFGLSIKSPGLAFRLFLAAALFAFGVGLLVLTVAAFLHSLLGIGGPWIDMNFRTSWAIVGSVLFVYKLLAFRRGGFY